METSNQVASSQVLIPETKSSRNKIVPGILVILLILVVLTGTIATLISRNQLAPKQTADSAVTPAITTEVVNNSSPIPVTQVDKITIKTAEIGQPGAPTIKLTIAVPTDAKFDNHTFGEFGKVLDITGKDYSLAIEELNADPYQEPYLSSYKKVGQAKIGDLTLVQSAEHDPETGVPESANEIWSYVLTADTVLAKGKTCDHLAGEPAVPAPCGPTTISFSGVANRIFSITCSVDSSTCDEIVKSIEIKK